MRPLRTLIVSDTHSNLEGLRAVIADAKDRGGIDAIWCAGDVVGYGAEPSEVIAELKRRDVRGVALVPGCGEYALATEPVTFHRGKGEGVVLNVHNDRGIADLKASLDQLEAELPGARSVSLVASWFGDDLRCDRCTLRPKVEQDGDDGDPMPWVVSGLARGAASPVGRLDGRPMFGGTPADEVDNAPGHHSPLFRIQPEPSVTAGVEAMVIAAETLMPRG